MLRTYVNDIFVLIKNGFSFFYYTAIMLHLYILCCIYSLLIGHTEWVEVFIVVLTQWIAYPVITQEQTAHIRMSYKADTIIVVYFAFIEFSTFPNITYTRKLRFFSVGCASADHYVFSCLRIFQMIDYT